jgi:Na+/melibiose symporter-like transporter
MAEESEEREMAKWLILAIALVSALGLVPILSRVKRTRGKKLLFHVIFVGVTTLLLFLVPENFQDIVFSVRNGERVQKWEGFGELNILLDGRGPL